MKSVVLPSKKNWPWLGKGLVYSLLISLLPLGVSPARAALKPADLRCEYLVNPLGIDAPQPRLSWKLVSTSTTARGQRQTTYEILVASRPELLDKNQGDLWSGGRVDSDQSTSVVYAGKPLRSGQACYWKVRVQDQAGHLSPWSSPAHWSMGLLQPADWQAQWIGADPVFVRGQGWPPPDNTVPDPWLRKTFELPQRPSRAVLYVASIGYYDVYVNGKKVGDAVLEPSATDFSHRARYRTYDITSQLKPGRNVIGLWLGVSWSIYPKYKTADKPQAPLVIAQADVELPGNAIVRVATDSTWKTHPSPNRLLGVWDFMHFGGELYDANREIPGWCEPDFDDAGWKTASQFQPKVVLSADAIEPNRRVREIRPLAMETVGPETYRVDMGVNYAGWFEIKLAGQPGDRIELQFSENPKEVMTHRLHSTYILGPTGKGTFRHHFNYGAGRWIQIKGLRTKPQLEDVRGWLVRTDYARATQFECDQPLLNRIYQTTLWTFENLSLGGYVVDCPQRERMGYGGDAHATTSMGLNNYDLGAFYTKWSQDWRDVQGPDGNLPYTAPTYWGGGGPGWSGFCVTLPWEIYQRYGDVRILDQNFPTMQRWLNFLETKSRDNLLVRWGGEWDFLGDWLWPGAEGVNGDTPETLFFNNCYWLYNLQTAAQVAQVLGNLDAARQYRQRAEAVKAAVHAKFYHAADHSYASGNQAYQAFALLVDLPPMEIRPLAWKRLEDEILVRRKGHIYAGITGGAFLFKTLLANNRNDLIYTMASQKDYPSWGDMLERGATTFWESWEGKLSLLHSSYLYVGTWFIEGLAGIKPDPQAPGFKHFLIKPAINLAPKLNRAAADYESIQGKIRSRWELKNNQIHLEVMVPPNTSATVVVPTPEIPSLRESGRSLAKVKGIKSVQPSIGEISLELESGHYFFTARAPGSKP
jgi:alpha-L-rhamnosidase